jgi:hypothetical protein
MRNCYNYESTWSSCFICGEKESCQFRVKHPRVNLLKILQALMAIGIIIIMLFLPKQELPDGDI